MIKICPHCGKDFECKENDILNCECVDVKLSSQDRARIASVYNECLCIRCLKNFESQETAG